MYQSGQRRPKTKTSTKIRIRPISLSLSASLSLVSMGTQHTNADAESLQGLLNLNLGVDDNNAENVNGSQPAKSTGTNQPLGIEFVENILKYEFKDKNLLLQAFTDASFDENCVSYERLEFLGDTVLNMFITKYLYHLYEDSAPGSLTRLRSVNVDTEKLARVAVKHNLHRCLRHNKPLLEDQILKFSKEIEKYPLHSFYRLEAPKTLADIVESTIGALYTDCDSFDTVCKVIKPLLEPIITLDKLEKHPVTKLNEMCQKKNLKLKFDDSSWETDKTVLVLIEDHLVGSGHHLTKKEVAKNCAANNALDNFSQSFPNI
ncbi:unnamed protein product [Eruca vesicaria subsp. sativa]|uniref:RNase III domain-containing protein n=1 Tax=Eruca vesicaria subsp. sativa TaxID=29727 RepID=A0ABC8J811_ERUVS|nr:unnamed protein product [Eruca vesicaria subsp. sativa]